MPHSPLILAASATLILAATAALTAQPQESGEITLEDVAAAARVIGLEFEPDELELMLSDVREHTRDIDSVRQPLPRMDGRPELRSIGVSHVVIVRNRDLLIHSHQAIH